MLSTVICASVAAKSPEEDVVDVLVQEDNAKVDETTINKHKVIEKIFLIFIIKYSFMVISTNILTYSTAVFNIFL